MSKSYNARIAANPYIVGSFACIGGGLFGLDISSMSGVITNPHYLKQYHSPGAPAQGAIVAAMPAGSLVGAFLTAWLGDLVGRKRTIMLSGLFWVVGCVLQCASVDRGMLCAGRVIAGLAVGIASTVVPLYQAEITAPSIRGRLISLQQWSITWGILIQYFIQFGCSYIDGQGSFRLPWGLQMIPAILLSVGMMWFPESPRWLYDNDRPEEALEVLADLHGGGDQQNDLVQLEYQEIAEQVNYERTQGSKSWFDLLEPGIFRRVSLGFFLQVWSQMSGMNVMMYYILYVFQGAGLVGVRAGLIAASVQYVLNMAFTVPAILWIDKWGRRPMLLAGFGGMCIFLCLVGGLQGGYGSFDSSNNWVIVDHKGATYAVIVCSYLCVCSFSPFVGPVSWTYPAEIFPMRVRSKAIAISTMGNWSFNTALAFFAPVALKNIAYRTYFLFAGFCAVAFIHVLFMFPETAGRTLEEVDEVFQHGHVFSAWALSDRNIGKKTLSDIKKGPEGHVDEKSDHGSESKDV